jgi:hypothetical protein
MTGTVPRVTVRDMRTDAPVQTFVLQEFRLLAADTEGAAARIVAAAGHGIEPHIPLLTSIGDKRDVATVRAFHAGEATDTDAAEHGALDPFVLSWEQPKHYWARIGERSQTPATYFRLAVTESGINTQSAPSLTFGKPTPVDGTASRPVGLIWIGAPVGTHAGLFVLLGSYDDPRAVRPDPAGWPFPLSRQLGVRIYENGPI